VNGSLLDGIASSGTLAQEAFGVVFGPVFGKIFVAVCLFFFAFSTILSWNFFGKINFQYLFGKKAVPVYTVLAIGFVFLGSIFQNDLVWNLADFFNNLMVIPNAIALITLGVAGMVTGYMAKQCCCKCECELPADAPATTSEEE
jgi:AGCS family alanine or glycine:cation symporter